MTDVSVRELKNNLSQYLRRAEAGEQIVVKRRGKRVAVISGEAKGPEALEDKLRRLVDAGILASAGKGKFVPPKTRITLRGEGPTMSEMIIEDRR